MQGHDPVDACNQVMVCAVLLQSASKSCSSMAWMCTTSCQILASSGTNQGTEKGDLMVVQGHDPVDACNQVMVDHMGEGKEEAGKR